MARQKKALRAFIGIMPRRVISDFDGFEINVEIRSQEYNPSREANFQLIARPSDYDGERVWYTHIGYRFLSEYADEIDLRKALKALTGVKNYIKKLPVEPELPHEYIAAILHKYNVGEFTVAYYKDEHSRPEIFEKPVSLNRVTTLIKEILTQKAPAISR